VSYFKPCCLILHLKTLPQLYKLCSMQSEDGLLMMNWEGQRMKQPWPTSKHYNRIYLHGLKTLSQGSRSPGRHSKAEHPEFEVKVTITL